MGGFAGKEPICINRGTIYSTYCRLSRLWWLVLILPKAVLFGKNSGMNSAFFTYN